MVGNRGQVMALWLVIITLFMVGLIVAIYFVQHKQVEGMIVSPRVVLKLEDNMEIFEMKESELLVDARDDVLKTDSWESGVELKIKNNFCEGFSKEGFVEYSEFLFENLWYEGENNPLAFKEAESKKAFCNNVYEFDFEEGVVIEREFLIKTGRRLTKRKDEVGFDFGIEYLNIDVIRLGKTGNVVRE